MAYYTGGRGGSYRSYANRPRHDGTQNCDLGPIKEVLDKHPIDVSKLRDNPQIEKAVKCFRDKYKDKRNRSEEEELQKFILRKIPKDRFFDATPQERLDWAIILAFYLKSFELKTNQVRKILDLAREVQLEFRGEQYNEDRIRSKLMRMRFMLAYSVGKEGSKSLPKKALETLYLVLDPLLLEVANSLEKKKFEALYDFVQAVMAYHRFLGGSEK